MGEGNEMCIRGRSDVCPIAMLTSQKGCATNLVYKDFHMERLLVGNNFTRLIRE